MPCIPIFSQKDFKAADIPKSTPEGKIDFHAFRVAYINSVIESGATVKEAQVLARHSTPNLTINIYGRTRRDRLTELTERVGASLEKVSDYAVFRIPDQKCGNGEE